jgi:hypothetical protein
LSGLISGSNDDQHNSTRKGNATQDEWQRDGLFGLLDSLDGAIINDLLATRVSNALIGKSHYPEDD